MGKPKRFYINIWDGCNLNCIHCFNYAGKAKGKLLSISEIFTSIEEAQHSLGIEEVQLTGGEPTQRPDIFMIIHELIKRKLKILLQSNGFFNRDILKEILDLPEDMISLIISLDGIETNNYFRGKNVTKKVIENIKILSQKFQIRINTLLSSKIKWYEIEQLASMAKMLNLVLAFNPICPSGKADISLLMPTITYFDWMYYLEEFRRQGMKIRKCFDVVNGQLIENENCPVRTGIAIHLAADGSTYPCGFLVNNPSCYLGSIRELSLSELRKRIPHYCKALPSQCLDCEYYKNGFCHCGCPARIYSIYGKFDEVDFYCIAKYYQQKGQ